MAEETIKIPPKKRGGFFAKIPKDKLFSPAGMLLIFIAAAIEIADLIPLPLIDQLWELPLELIFIAMLVVVMGVPIQATIIPFVIERIPIINDVVPTWLIKMFM
jgi:hypothetical protein